MFRHRRHQLANKQRGAMLRRAMLRRGMLRPALRRPTLRRPGMTLVEMLLVIAILTMLAVAVLPLMAPALEGRKVREAAREVNAFVAGAQARAAEKGRPVGIWLERTDRGAASVYTMFLAEVQPPYSGDILGATGRMIDRDADGIMDAVRFDSASGSYSMPALVKKGDLIRFNFRGPLYPITYLDQFDPANPPMSGEFDLHFRPQIDWHPGPNLVWGAVGDDDGMNGADDIGEQGLGDDRPLLVPTPLSRDFTGDGIPDMRVQFQIYRQPTRSMATPLNLPTGAAIDLNHSGMGAAGQHFAPANLGAIVDDKPVIIMFNPSGAIEQIYYGELVPNPSIAPPENVELIGHKPAGPVHLLIGTSEQFERKVPDNTSTPVETTFFTNFLVDLNLADPSSKWVSIGHRTGSITSSENGWALVGSPPNFIESLATAREYARTAQHMGGN